MFDLLLARQEAYSYAVKKIGIRYFSDDRRTRICLLFNDDTCISCFPTALLNREE